MTNLARLAAVVALTLAATPALADAPRVDAQPTARVQAAAPAQVTGLSPEAVRVWLSGLGAESATVTQEGDQAFLRVQDGQLTWGILFFGCENGLCSNLQYTGVFNAGADVTLERLNQWNIDKRFLKAFLVPAEGDQPPAAVIQYDLIVQADEGTDQLQEPTVIWVEMIREFATYVGFGTEAEPVAAPAQ